MYVCCVFISYIDDIICIMDYYSALSKKELLPFVTTWMNLKDILLSEISQAQKNTYHVTTYMRGQHQGP